MPQPKAVGQIYSTRHEFPSVKHAVCWGKLQDIHATFVPLGISCQAGCYCNTQYSQVAKTVHISPRQHAVRLRVEIHRFTSPAATWNSSNIGSLVRPILPNWQIGKLPPPHWLV